MSYPLSFQDPEPKYIPEFPLSDNFNVLYLSEIHAFEPENKKLEYLNHISDQVNEYVEMYDIDRVSILGDTGSIEDVEKVLEPVRDDIEIWIVAGDEDKVEEDNEKDKEWVGWFEEAESPRPFEIENDYKIFDEGYETEIRGHKIQAAHHPNKVERRKADIASLSEPDPRAISDDVEKEPETPEAIYQNNQKDSFLERLFSVERDSNEAKEDPPLFSLENADIFIYDHVHMPYIRKLFESAVMGLGGRSHNYQLDSDCMPKRSIHLNSYGEDKVHSLHFDSDNDQIFEHEIFDFEDELEIFCVDTSECSKKGNNYPSYLPLQSRFHPTQIDVEEAYEEPEMQPNLWRNRDSN